MNIVSVCIVRYICLKRGAFLILLKCSRDDIINRTF